MSAAERDALELNEEEQRIYELLALLSGYPPKRFN